MSDNLGHFENFRVCAFLRASYAHAARMDGRNSVSLSDFNSNFDHFIYFHVTSS